MSVTSVDGYNMLYATINCSYKTKRILVFPLKTKMQTKINMKKFEERNLEIETVVLLFSSIFLPIEITSKFLSINLYTCTFFLKQIEDSCFLHTHTHLSSIQICV